MPQSAAAGAAADAAAGDGTVDQLVAMALERSPEIRAARTAVAVASGQTLQAGLRPNPMLSATQMQMSGAQHQSLFEVEWPLDLFRRGARVDAAKQAADATGFSVQDRERMLALAVRRQAGVLLVAQRTLEVTAEALATARRMRELLDSRVTEGEIPKIDANLAAVAANRVETEVVLAQADVDSALIELRAVVGLPAGTAIALRETLEAAVSRQPSAVGGQASTGGGPQAGAAVDAQTAGMPSMPNMDMSKATSAMRPDVREAAARVAAASARVESARQQGRLDMSLVGNYGQEHYSFAQRGVTAAGTLAPIEGDFHSVTFGATLTLPVRNRNQGALAAAEAERSGEEQVLAARQLAAQAEVDAATLRDREARRAAMMYAMNVRDLARENVEIELESYDLGRTALTDLLAEQRRYLDIEGGYTALLSRAYDAAVALKSARGETR
jgi:cobalt-zinc-cadmium efflux system outer membrane protein